MKFFNISIISFFPFVLIFYTGLNFGMRQVATSGGIARKFGSDWESQKSSPEPSVNASKDPIDFFDMGLRFSPSGLRCFFKHTYNNEDYCLDFLPNNMSHLTQFLRHGLRLSNRFDFAETALRLFKQKITAGTYTNPYAVEAMIDDLKTIAPSYGIGYNGKDGSKKTTAVKEILYDKFLSNFDDFRKDPKKFFDELATKIVDTTDSAASEQENINRLQGLLLRLMESALHRIVWSAEDGLETLDNMGDLGNKLVDLQRLQIIIAEEDLNDLLQALVSRYKYFLELTGSLLPEEFYKEAPEKITGRKFDFLDIPECEEMATTKREILTRAIEGANISRYSHEFSNIVPEIIPQGHPKILKR